MRTPRGTLFAFSGALVVVVLLVTACGDDGLTPEERASASAASASASEASASAAAEAKALARQQARYQRCKRSTQELISQLQQVDSRLNIGLNYSEYGDRLGDVQVAYDKLAEKVSDAGRRCIRKVALPLEKSFNAYSTVHTLWGDCIDDYGCDFSSGETNDKAQAGWLRASKALDRAKSALEGMAPANG